MNKAKPTKKQMQIYESIRTSGATNMFDINQVVYLSKGRLAHDNCIYIMADDNYAKLLEEYNILRGYFDESVEC